MLILHDGADRYLEDSFYIDWKSDSILQAARRMASSGGEIETARNAYHFVRDEIRRCWDAQDHRVTARATEVLREGIGICWAKAAKCKMGSPKP